MGKIRIIRDHLGVARSSTWHQIPFRVYSKKTTLMKSSRINPSKTVGKSKNKARKRKRRPIAMRVKIAGHRGVGNIGGYRKTAGFPSKVARHYLSSSMLKTVNRLYYLLQHSWYTLPYIGLLQCTYINSVSYRVSRCRGLCAPLNDTPRRRPIRAGRPTTAVVGSELDNEMWSKGCGGGGAVGNEIIRLYTCAPPLMTRRCC